MFLGKKKQILSAYVEGDIYPIEQCSDPVFSKKMMGDGCFIVPKKNTIFSPIQGKVVMIYPTKHAIGLVDEKGNEFLLHIGLETVSLNGEGFEVMVTQDQVVDIHTPLVTVDLKLIESKQCKSDVILVNTNGVKINLLKTGFVLVNQEIGRY